MGLPVVFAFFQPLLYENASCPDATNATVSGHYLQKYDVTEHRPTF